MLLASLLCMTGVWWCDCTGHESWVLSVACHPSGSSFATGSSDAKVKLWDLQTRTCAQTLSDHTDQVPILPSCPALHRFEAVLMDFIISAEVSCANHFRLRSAVQISPAVGTLGCDCSQCPAHALTVTSMLHEDSWQSRSRRLLGVQVWSVAWQTDGRRLATASDDKSVAFYNLA